MQSLHLLSVVNKHVLVTDHHLHPAVVHEVVVVATKRCTVLVVEELCKRQVVWEDKGTDCILVHEICLAMHGIVHHLPVALEVLCLTRSAAKQDAMHRIDSKWR
jgi:hypothetical protein